MNIYKDRIWIPEDRDLRSQLIIISHYGLSGHSGVSETIKKLREHFSWRGLNSDVKRLVQDCILCRMAKEGEPTRIHFGEHVRPTKPNQIIHIDYFSMVKSYNGYSYLVIMRYGFSRFIYMKEKISG